ncbi:MAG: hypothetical protein K9H16_10550 [Bacteroidales bacterium]|nr:hypothetical protein [Bacteroidales bacterium]
MKTQNLLASEINRIKSEFQEEIEAFGKVNRDLEDEKLMLENQIIEVKKAWESEVMKRKEFENYDKNNIPSEASKVNDELVEQLSARLNQRDIELQEMKMKLEKNESNDKILLQLKSRIDRLNRDLKLENEARNVAEKELVLLIEKINEISKSYSS